MAPFPDILQSEKNVPVDQSIKDLLHNYFLIWEIIEQEEEAKRLAEAVVHPDFSGRFVTGSTGPERVLQIAKNRRKAFANSKFYINDGDVFKNAQEEICVPYLFTGTYQGSFLPEEALGKTVAMHGVAYYKIKEGKLLGLRSERDEESMFRQLGVSRPTGETIEF